MATPRLPINGYRLIDMSRSTYVPKAEQLERRAAAMRKRNARLIETRQKSKSLWASRNEQERRRITERARLAKAARSTRQANDTGDRSVAA